ncbi:hypothetical protein F5Y01DRAFT_211338 [Xylaria sp. FL0043]|nr:hypothetical protein F5Y01DRAFT_211338 [Xylaria sp. FL0043]
MVMRWLMNRFFLTSENSPIAEPEQAVGTFHRFPDLPTELRLQIWEHYFDVPRIHVLYPSSSRSRNAPNDTPTAYADLTAKANRNVPASLRFAAATINYEALEVFRNKFDLVHLNFMDLPSKFVKDLFDSKFRGLVAPQDPEQPLSIPKSILQSTPDLAEVVRNPSRKPRDMVMPGVHINWENDLLYLTDGTDVNCETLRRVCNGPIAGRLRRVAILIHDSCKYDGWRHFLGPSVDFPKPCANLAEVILVVRLNDIDPSAHATAERDGFGFVPYDSVIQGKQEGNSWEWTQNMKLIERRFVYVAQLLHEAFPDLEDHKIKWAVDIDYTHRRAETPYSRTLR